MSKLEDIRRAIIERLEQIEYIGIVHDHQPYIKTEADLRELYTENGLLLGWYVRRVATQESAGSINQWIETHTWMIWGVMALGDDGRSEIDFDALIESIRDVFREDQSLGGVVSITETGDGAGIQVEKSEPVFFCGKLCHAAHLLLRTVSYRY
ncbi:MAG: hypothetical protein HQL97_04500 [Magnetococcales bacterium]|nr:hypothetical protein [Magnetococcales bacterium]